MQCGQVRHKVDAKVQAATRTFVHRVRLRETAFRLPPEASAPLQIHALYTALAADDKRNDLIFDDVLTSLDAGRRPVILTERRDHLEYLQARFDGFTRNLVVMYGGIRIVRSISCSLPAAILGKDSMIRPSIPCFLPCRSRGRLRSPSTKQEVIVFDYADSGVPMLLRMALKRQSGYRSLGYSLDTAPATVPVA
jgi:hypothetical protein